MMYICKYCGKSFIPKVKKKTPPVYCSRQCRGNDSKLIKRINVDELLIKINNFILTNKRYTTSKELALNLNISTKTISKYFNITTLNSNFGFYRNYSIFEELVYSCLKEKYTDYTIIREKTFHNLKSNKNYKLRFDFFIKELNLLIEADGIQHTVKSNWYVEGQLERDVIKNIYCETNNIKLIRIPQTYSKDVIFSYLI